MVSSLQPAIKLVGKKLFGVILFFIGLVIILAGYVASYVLKSNATIALGLLAGFMLILAGSEFLGVE